MDIAINSMIMLDGGQNSSNKWLGKYELSPLGFIQWNVSLLVIYKILGNQRSPMDNITLILENVVI